MERTFYDEKMSDDCVLCTPWGPHFYICIGGGAAEPLALPLFHGCNCDGGCSCVSVPSVAQDGVMMWDFDLTSLDLDAAKTDPLNDRLVDASYVLLELMRHVAGAFNMDVGDAKSGWEGINRKARALIVERMREFPTIIKSFANAKASEFPGFIVTLLGDWEEAVRESAMDISAMMDDDGDGMDIDKCRRQPVGYTQRPMMSRVVRDKLRPSSRIENDLRRGSDDSDVSTTSVSSIRDRISVLGSIIRSSPSRVMEKVRRASSM